MTPNEYQQAALRTDKQPEPSYFRGSPQRDRLLHAAIGISTEVGELFDAYKRAWIYGTNGGHVDRVNVLEECGDTMWYVNLGADACDRTLQSIVALANEMTFHGRTELEMCAAAHHGADRILAQVFDNMRPAFALGCVTRAVIELLKMHSYTLEQAFERNIAKLAKRYPGKFTEHAALNRDLDAERAMLESK